jgi:hypothetical protein
MRIGARMGRIAAMSVLHMYVSQPHQGTVRPVRAFLGIFLGFSLSLATLFLIVLSFVGLPRLLAGTATIKPYSVAYQSPAVLGPPDGQSHPKNPIIFLGDSSVAQPPWAPEGLSGIPDLLHETLHSSDPRPASTHVVDWSFPGGRPFHYYCLLFEAEKHEPSLVVIPINWRGMGPLADEWNERFAYPELSSLVPTEEKSFPLSAALMRSESISQSRQLLYTLHRPMLYVGGMKNLIRSGLAPEPVLHPQIDVLKNLPPGEHLIERYGDKRLFRQYSATFAENTPSMTALRLIVETAGRRDILVCFYITPIHLDEMRARPSFDVAAFETSIERVVAATTSKTTLCLDLSGLLEEDHFLDNYEHYTLEGNRRIARALAPAILDLMAR